MAVVIAGAASGVIMALAFATVSAFMLFGIVKNPPEGYKAILNRFPPGTLVMTTVTLGYPVWLIIGTVIALLYRISSQQVPGAGLGSPNLVFTVSILACSILLPAPFIVLVKPLRNGLLIVSVVFAGVFGWFMPILVEA